jgi:hypothetical protein
MTNAATAIAWSNPAATAGFVQLPEPKPIKPAPIPELPQRGTLATRPTPSRLEPVEVTLVSEEPSNSLTDAVIRRISPAARSLPIGETAIVLQHWEGYVEQVSKESFKARLLDRTSGNVVDTEVAEISKEEIEPDDQELISEGAIFYFTIRRRRMPNGRHEISRQFVFRRLPAWHPEALKRAEREAAEMEGLFARFE